MRGVGVPIGGVVDRVLVPMTGSFTHAVQHTVTGVPVTPRGPDRLHSTLAIDLGDGFMLLPHGPRDALLPFTGVLSFVGVPPLTGPLSTNSYITSVEALTGGLGGIPQSAILRFRSRISGTPTAIGPFVPLAKFTMPAIDKPWDGRTVKFDLPTATADLVIMNVSASDGSTAWTIVTPGDTRQINLPDFSAKPELGVPVGNLVLGVVAAKLEGFSYDAVRYGQLGRSAWSAFSYETAFGYW